MSTSICTSDSISGSFQLKPLVVCMRVAIAGGMVAGGIMTARADNLPIPVPGQGWVSSGVAAIDASRTTADHLAIKQTSNKAIYNWKEFNVGKDQSVDFDQKEGASSIALNRIFQETPSKIMGKITSNGQVYLVNQNGIVFDKGSKVDVNTLVATSLNISDDAFNKGIIRVFDQNRGNQSLDQAALGGKDNGVDPVVNQDSKVEVKEGASIHAQGNGKIILAAPEVSNEGNIDADKGGQILLVASQDKVYLQPADDKSPFSGLLVEVGKGGKVTNTATGNISTRQGNISLAGFAVNQQGRVSATTSVNVNGSIRLLAREKAQDVLQDGQYRLRGISTERANEKSEVVFKDGSITEVKADVEGGSAFDDQTQKDSYVEVSANKIHMEGGSAIKATSGKVSFAATDNPMLPGLGSKGRILLDKGSRIDVSGAKDVKVAMERNVADISVQSFNLRDAPYQRGGILQGATVKVDIRKNTKILDASGGGAKIKRGIDERMAQGGEIDLVSSGDVIVNSGAVTDISGGSLSYQDGYINTSKLVDRNGRIVDISDADPNEHYVSIFGQIKENHDKWAMSKTWNILTGLGTFEKGYTEGKAAGSLNVQSPLSLLNGNVVSETSNGLYQRTNPVPGGKLNVNSDPNSLILSNQNVRFQQQAVTSTIGIDDLFPRGNNNQASDLLLSSELVNNSGLSSISIKTGGDVAIADDAAISLPALGSLTLEGKNINVDGSVYSAGGTVDFNSISLGTAETGKLNLSRSAAIDVSGRWVNDFKQAGSSNQPAAAIINAGKVGLKAANELNLNSGATIKADGGAWLEANGKTLTAGKAGEIKLTADSGGNTLLPGVIHLDGELSAYGLRDGGKLTLASNVINIGSDRHDANALNLGITNNNFDFAQKLGFSSINLASKLGPLTVKSEVDLKLVTQNRVFVSDYRNQASAKSIENLTELMQLSEDQRKPVALSLESPRTVVVENGSRIQLDTQSSVKINVGNEGKGIFIDGTIETLAGSIDMGLRVTNGSLPYDAGQAIWLGSNAKLITHGTTRTKPVDTIGRVMGDVLNGGSITAKADRGYVIFEEGSQLDISGTNAVLDLQRPVSDAGLDAKQSLASDAGKISVTAAEGIVLDGTIQAHAGATNNRGGRLEVVLDRNKRDEGVAVFPSQELHIDVMQNETRTLPVGTMFGSNIPTGLNGVATLSSEEVEQSGVSDLRLSVPELIGRSNQAGEIRFVNDVSLATSSSIDIDAQTIKWFGTGGATTGSVKLNTDFLKMGAAKTSAVVGTSLLGGGNLTANAGWMQLNGAAMLTGFKDVNLNSQHDLRLVGYRLPGSTQRAYVGNLKTAANLNLSAGQIYPSTLSNFTIAVTDPNGTLKITGQNSEVTPLAAAGKLVLNAPTIEQNGVLKAPLGTIEFNASKSLSIGDGSLTSVSADGKTIPLGKIVSNVWQYPLESGVNLVFNEAPENQSLGEKHLVLNSPSIDLKRGSVIDVAGGGDLLAFEFQPGLGGSSDYLAMDSSSYKGGFAILPTLNSSFSPYDHFLNTGFDFDPRTQVHLDGVGALAAGDYTILPARYALLPGAYLVTPQTNTQDQSGIGYTASGLPIVSGYQLLAGTNIKDSRRSGFLVETSEQVKKQSEYNIQTANKFFTEKAVNRFATPPILPVDSGQISIQASNKLNLDGEFKVAANKGKGAKLDISSQAIKIVNSQSASAAVGVLEILDSDLSGLKVDSLLLGGVRQYNQSNGVTDLAVTANDVIFDQGAKIQALDLMVVGKNSVQVKQGAVLEAGGNANAGDSAINIKGDGALLKVSAGKQITVNRSDSLGSKGSLLVEEGAILRSSKSMYLDSSKSSTINGDIDMQGGELNIAANVINLGDYSGNSGSGLNLSNQKLEKLLVDDLVLTSRGQINLYGNVGHQGGDNDLTPHKFKHLVLDATGLSGFGDGNTAAKLQADTLTLQNTSGKSALQAGSGSGTLDLIAKDFSQGSGDFAISGFSETNVDVGNRFTVKDNSRINLASKLNLNAGLITTLSGRSLTIDAGSSVDGVGHEVSIKGNPIANEIASKDLGGSISIIGKKIDVTDAKVLMPSGSFSLQAETGDIKIGGTTSINLAGTKIGFGDNLRYTPGGVFSADAEQGQILLDSGTTIDLSANEGVSGGQLNLKAAGGSVSVLGKLKANHGSAAIDMKAFASGASFDELVNKLSDAGISETLSFRVRNDNITQNSAIKARSLTLVADNGAIDINGILNANALKQAGDINLFAGGKITLEDGALISAKGSKGGQVLLSSATSLLAGQSGIEIKSGSTIDVNGVDVNQGGIVRLAALRDGNGINIKPIAGLVKGYKQFYAQGVRKYGNAELGNDGSIGTLDINRINLDNANYMSGAVNVESSLGGGVKLTPWAEIDYHGDLALASQWDFASQRFGRSNDLPGSLVVRATGKLDVNNSLTDGYRDNVLMSGDSWSFQLVSGADLASADISATSSRKDISLAADTSIHTGSGEIKLSAGGNLVFKNQTSTVYTAGRPDKNNPYGTLDGIQTLDYSTPYESYLGPDKLTGDYPVEGGKLVIRAGGNIQGATSSQFINAWLERQGNYDVNGFADSNNLTAWAVNAENFQQNIGSFGGGDVDIVASGNIADLSVMMPTTGKQKGLDFAHNSVEIHGGGNMNVSAGGNVTGGVYFLGRGVGNISAKGEIAGSNKVGDSFAFTNGPQIVLSGDQANSGEGDSQFALNATRGVKVAGVSDAMVLNPNASEFFTYTAGSGIDIKSLAGDVELYADVNQIAMMLGIDNDFNQKLVNVYPASLEAVAFGGSIKFGQNIILYPSAVSNVSLFANQNIATKDGAASQYGLIMSDADPDLLPKAGSPMFADFNDDNLRLSGKKFDSLNIFGNLSAVRDLIHSKSPLHKGDNNPVRVVTQNGDISGVQFNFPKLAIIQAGRDLKNASVQIQHAVADNASVISAGRDLMFETALTRDGLMDRDKAANKIEVAGPGDVLIKTGRDMDLGTAVGVSTVGNLYNPNLPSQGASLDVVVGLNSSKPDYAAFVTKYQDNPLYLEKLSAAKEVITQYMRQRTANSNLSASDAFEAFKQLGADETLPVQSQLNALITSVFFNELKVAGTASAADKTIGNEAGFTAIETLFPGDKWQGDLNMIFSKLHTVSGGDINLFVPGGKVNAGLAVAPSGASDKKVEELGIVAQGQGEINALVKNDFIVNTSRVFTLGGGDILIWSSEGDIDAGKGAKSALSVKVDPPYFDEHDQLVVPAPVITDGSGIRTASAGQSSGSPSSPRRQHLAADKTPLDPGDVYLMAPKGVVDAGEAGIAGSNVTISATAVLGANNIQVGGIGTGVPVTSTTSVAAGLTGSSNLAAGVSQMAESSVGDEAKKAANNFAKTLLGILSLDFLGFGD